MDDRTMAAVKHCGDIEGRRAFSEPLGTEFNDYHSMVLTLAPRSKG